MVEVVGGGGLKLGVLWGVGLFFCCCVWYLHLMSSFLVLLGDWFEHFLRRKVNITAFGGRGVTDWGVRRWGRR